MTRTGLSLILLGTLVAACQEPPPPAAATTGAPQAAPRAAGPATASEPVTGLAPASASDAAPALAAPLNQPNGPYTENVPPTSVNVNPPGTPAYVIAPGDPVGRRNAQYPRPGGGPAF